MEARLLLAFVLMGLVLFGTQYFYKPPPQANKAAATVAKNSEPAANSGAAKASDAPKPIPTKPASDVAADLPGQVNPTKKRP